MRRLEVLLILGTAISLAVTAEFPRLRGVGPEFAKFYKSTDKFTCISNPSIQIDVSQVNDDYCDCPDGSDEPGTSACSYLSNLSPPTVPGTVIVDTNATPALPGFYCKNKGHKPDYLPFTNVNDGICDYDICCDGSDEFEGVGGVICEDKCKEIGKEWRKQDEQRKKSLGAAQKKRRELVAEALRLRQEVSNRIGTLSIEVVAAEERATDMERQLQEVERLERGKAVKSAGKGSKVTVLAGLAKERTEELRNSLITVRRHRDSVRERLNELELILSAFKEEYNPNFNDEGVKRAVRRWEEYAARGVGNIDGDVAADDRDLDEISKPDSETGAILWEEWENVEEDSDVALLYKFEEYLPRPIREWVDQKLHGLRLLLVENGILAPISDSFTESKAVMDARSNLDSARNDLSQKQSELDGHREDINKDYGVDDVFRALKGQCVSKESGEYIYELCWFEHTTQKPMKGGGNTGMGNFVRIDRVTVDDELPPDGKGLGSGERIALRYENGQHCWNGPSRSTLVVLGCAENDEIWKVVEEEKCIYRMEVGTPAACEANGSGAKAKGTKDEL